MAAQGQQRQSLKVEPDAESAVVRRRIDKYVKMTAVRKDGIMKELIEKEEKNKDFWNDKFGFLLTSNKEFNDHLVKLQLAEAKEDKKNKESPLFQLKVPVTASGMVGWRADRAAELNVAGPLYVSPMSTVIADGARVRKMILTQKHIVLG